MFVRSLVVTVLFAVMMMSWNGVEGLGGLNCYVCDDTAQTPCSSPKEYTNCRFCFKEQKNGKMKKKCVSVGDEGGGVGFPEQMTEAECLVDSGSTFCACASTRCNSALGLKQSALLVATAFGFASFLWF